MRKRRGFTLIEVLIAIVLIDVALLALVAESATLIAQRNALMARSAAVRAASNRIEELAAVACLASSGTAIGERGIEELWRVDVGTNGTRELIDSVTFPLGRDAKAFVLRTRLPCR